MSDISQARVARDAGGERTRFEEIEVGADLGEVEWVVTPEMIDWQCVREGDFHEWFMHDSPFGGRIAPPLINYGPPRQLFSKRFHVRGLFYHYECEFFAPIRPNTRMVVRARIIDKWVNKNQREFVAYEATCHDESGQLIFRTRRAHALDYLPRTAPKEGTGIDRGYYRGEVRE